MPANDYNNIRRLADYQQTHAGSDDASLKGGGNDGTFDGMDGSRLDRIDKRLDAIEAEQRTHLRWFVTTTIALGALILATTGFLTSRLDRAEDRLTRVETSVNELPGKLTTSLNQLNQTLLQAVTASKQTPPQVILLPAPSPEELKALQGQQAK